MPMPATSAGARKRQAPVEIEEASDRPRSKKKIDTNPSPSPLQAPHQEIITALSTNYSVLPASIISSTKIHARVSAINTHLLALDPEKTPVAILYARPADVHKLITVVEQVKRVLQQEGKPWWQYNQLFMQSVEAKRKHLDQRAVVEETVLAGTEGDRTAESSEDDAFEPVKTRLEEAAIPPAPSKAALSLRVLVSIDKLSELRTMGSVTVQSSTEKTS